MSVTSISTPPDDLITPDQVLFADPRTLLRDTLKFYLPPERISVADYAVRQRYLNNRGGGYVGRWNHAEAPYLVGPMEALTGPYLTTAVVGPARSGKTTIGQNWLLHAVETDPADFLVYAQTDDVLEAYVKAEIEPMIDLHPGMRSRLGQRPKDRSIKFKKFTGMRVEFLSATYNNLTNKSAPRIIITELDACDPSGDDTYALASIRRTTYGRESMVLAESHPDLAAGLSPERWNDGIMKLYRDSDRRTWWWPCPHCNAFSSPTPGTTREMVLHYTPDAPLDEIEQQAALLCPSCGCLIEDKWRRSMNQDGFWAGAGQSVQEDGTITGTLMSSDTAGFWITGLMSPFMIGGIGGLARELARTARDFDRTGDDTELRAITIKRAGIPYTPLRSVRSIDAEMLAARQDAALPLGRVPDGVRYLTAAVDVQSNRFELMVRGWGKDQESWIIDYRQIRADTAQSLDAWDSLIHDTMTRFYPLTDGSERGMMVLALGYDSGGEEGVTAQAYDAWRRGRRPRRIKFVGKTDGRNIYTVMPLKGMSAPSAPMLAVRYPESQRQQRLHVSADDVPLGQFNPNRFKDKQAGALLITEGPGCVHFPDGIAALHDFFDQLTAEERDLTGRWHKKKGARRNEVWDLMVMTDVMHSLFGGHKISWETPPAWAREWDTNIMVTTQPSESPAPTQPVPQPTKAAPDALAALMEQARTIGSNTPLPQRTSRR